MNLNGREINDLNDLEQAIRDGVPGAAELAASLESGSYTGPTSFPTPAENAGITSPYGNRTHPVTGREKLHTGIDIGDPGPGNLAGEPAVSIAPGVVQSAGPAGGYGNQVVVQHPDASVSTYNHLDSITVSPGQEIAAGWEVGKIGTTGISTGPHLHLEVFDPAGNRIDPNSLVSSLQTASQIAAGNTTANAVGQYGPETAVLGPSLRTPLADAPTAQAALPPLQTAFTPFTPSPNLAALPAARAIDGIRVGSPALTPAAIAQPTPAAVAQPTQLTSPPITQRAIPAGPLPAAISPTLPVANSPATTPVAGGQPVEEFGPPTSLAGAPTESVYSLPPGEEPNTGYIGNLPAPVGGGQALFGDPTMGAINPAPSFDARMDESQRRLQERLAALPSTTPSRSPLDTAPTNTGYPAIPMGVAPPMSGISVGPSLPNPVYGGITDSPATPFSLPAARTSQAPLPAAVSPSNPAAPIQVGGMLPATPINPVVPAIPGTPMEQFGPPIPEEPGLVDVFGPLFTQSAPAPRSPLDTAPSNTGILAPVATKGDLGVPLPKGIPAPTPSYQSVFGPEQALRSGIKVGATPWDQPPPATYNPPDLIAVPAAIPGLPNVSAPQDRLYNTVAPAGNLLSPTPFDPTLPVSQPGINVGSIGATPIEATGFTAPPVTNSIPVVQSPGASTTPATPGAPPTVQAPVQKPAPVPSTADLVTAAVAPDLQEMTQPITVGPKPNVGLRAPIGTQDLISGAVGGLLGGPMGAVMAPLGQRMLGSLGNLFGNPIQRMMQERERERLEAEAHGISVGVGWGGNSYGSGPGLGGNYGYGGGPLGFSGGWGDSLSTGVRGDPDYESGGSKR